MSTSNGNYKRFTPGDGLKVGGLALLMHPKTGNSILDSYMQKDNGRTVRLLRKVSGEFTTVNMNSGYRVVLVAGCSSGVSYEIQAEDDNPLISVLENWKVAALDTSVGCAHNLIPLGGSGLLADELAAERARKIEAQVLAVAAKLAGRTRLF